MRFASSITGEFRRTRLRLENSMVSCMATVKVTITLDEAQLADVRKRVADGEARNVSAFVQQAVARELDGDSALRAMIDEGLAKTGGPVTPKERAWVKRVLTSPAGRSKQTKRRRAA